MAAAAETGIRPAFPQLPHDVALRIFASLPADARLRCCEVSRGWCATVSTPALWRRLDLSRASGVTRPVSPLLLRAAVAKARGGLLELDVTDYSVDCDIPRYELEGVARVNPGLEELHGAILCDLDTENFLHQAGALRELHAHVAAFTFEAGMLLRNEGLFAPLRLRDLILKEVSQAGLLALRPALVNPALHPSLRAITWHPFEPPAVTLVTGVSMRIIADTYIVRRLSTLHLRGLHLALEAVPELGRLLREGALTDLSLRQCTGALSDAASVASLAGGLRASRLTTLTLVDVQLWHAPALHARFLDAVTAHPTLQTLCLHDEASGVPILAAAALAGIVGANAPALTALDVSSCGLGNGVEGVLEPLRHNTHLRELNIRGNEISAVNAREYLLPALRANTGLRTLETDFEADAAVLLQSAAAARDILARR